LWFRNKGDDGMTFREHFSPFPVPAMALVLVVVGSFLLPCLTDIFGVLMGRVIALDPVLHRRVG